MQCNYDTKSPVVYLTNTIRVTAGKCVRVESVVFCVQLRYLSATFVSNSTYDSNFLHFHRIYDVIKAIRMLKLFDLPNSYCGVMLIKITVIAEFVTNKNILSLVLR